ncbi:MAG: RDD family protein [Saprospiraceae bacterium]|nr:RDD family protein [Saprospiraceae bacterium]
MTDQDLILDELDQPQRFEPEYAGFWLRVAAYLIDSIIIGIPMYIIYGTIGGSFLEPNALSQVIGGVLGVFYFIYLESSEKQATFGKQAVGIIVTDMDGNRITGGQAAGRYFGKIVSGLILLIGFMMAGFTDKKQALHDIMANTLVVRR